MKFWKKKKETDIQSLIDELNGTTNAVKDSAIELAVLQRNTEILEDEWYRYCEAVKESR